MWREIKRENDNNERKREKKTNSTIGGENRRRRKREGSKRDKSIEKGMTFRGRYERKVEEEGKGSIEGGIEE